MVEQLYPVFEKETVIDGDIVERYKAIFSTGDGKKPRFSVSSIVTKVFSEAVDKDTVSPFIQSISGWKVYDPETASEGDVGVLVLTKVGFDGEELFNKASKFIAGQFAQQTHKG